MSTEKTTRDSDVRFVRIARLPLQLQAVPAPRVLHLRLHRRERAPLHDADPGGPEGGGDGDVLERHGHGLCWCQLGPEPDRFLRVRVRVWSTQAVRMTSVWSPRARARARFHRVDLIELSRGYRIHLPMAQGRLELGWLMPDGGVSISLWLLS